MSVEQSKLMDQIEFDFESFRDKNYLTHNYHPYPAKFVPQIPRRLIEVLSHVGDTVLDPFCGSGTTLVEAKLLGRNAIGVDLNPIATLATEAKTTCLTETQLSKAEEVVGETKRHISSFYGNTTLYEGESYVQIEFKLPKFLNRDHWFKRRVLQELAIIQAHIDLVEDSDLKNFLLTAFSSIIVSVSNQESDTRYARKDKHIKKEETCRLYANKVNDMVGRMLEFRDQSTASWTRVYRQDSRKLAQISDESVDLVVTSPPYLNAYDYYLYHRIRMHWLGYYSREIQELEIGSRYMHSDEDRGAGEYFANMRDCFGEVSRVLKGGRYCCVVVGDAIKDGQYIKVDEGFNQLMSEIGFAKQKQITYPLRKYTTSFTRGYKVGDKSGHVLIFKKH